METIRRIFRVDRQEINYLRVTLESYDGMTVVRTVDPDEAVIELLIAPGCDTVISQLLDDLREREGVRIDPIPLST
jgi:hypothetical protein